MRDLCCSSIRSNRRFLSSSALARSAIKFFISFCACASSRPLFREATRSSSSFWDRSLFAASRARISSCNPLERDIRAKTQATQRQRRNVHNLRGKGMRKRAKSLEVGDQLVKLDSQPPKVVSLCHQCGSSELFLTA